MPWFHIEQVKACFLTVFFIRFFMVFAGSLNHLNFFNFLLSEFHESQEVILMPF